MGKYLAFNDLPIISMVFGDFILTFEAKESAILCAGLGFWLTCKSLGG